MVKAKRTKGDPYDLGVLKHQDPQGRVLKHQDPQGQTGAPKLRQLTPVAWVWWTNQAEPNPPEISPTSLACEVEEFATLQVVKFEELCLQKQQKGKIE